MSTGKQGRYSRAERARAGRRLGPLQEAADALQRAELDAAKARNRLNRLVHDLHVRDKVPPSLIAETLGVSRQWVWKIIEKVKADSATKGKG